MSHASRELLKGASARLVLLFVGILIGFFMMPYLVRSLGENTYGLWIVAGSIVSFYSLLDVGMIGSMQRFMMRSIYKEDKSDINLTLSTNVFLTSILGVMALLVTLLIIFLAEDFVDDKSLVQVFRVIIALLGAKAAFQFPLFSFYGILMAKYKYHVISNIQLASSLIKAILIVGMVEANYGLIGIAVVTFVMEMAASIMITKAALLECEGLKVSFKGLSKEKFKDYMNFGKYAYVIAISNKVTISMDGLLVASLVSLVAVTQYTIGSTLIRYFESIMGSAFGVLGSVLNKYHVSGQIDKLKEVFLMVTELTALVAYFIGCGLYLFGAEFIESWMGNTYSESYVVLQILGLSAIIAMSQLANMQVLMAMARHKQQAYATGIEVLLNLSISIILGMSYGIYGIAIGTAIPLIVNSLLVRPMYTCKQINVKYSTYYKIQFKVVLLSLTAGGLIYWMKLYFSINGYFEIFLGGALFSIIYILMYVRYFMSNGVGNYVEENIHGKYCSVFKVLRGH